MVIFNVGASDKNQTLTHSLRTVELSGTGEAVRSAVIGVFVPNGGTITAAFEPGVTLVPYSDRMGGGNGVLGSAITQRSKWAETKSEAIWNEVPYWSLRKTSVQYEATSGHGQFTIDMKPSAQRGFDLEVRNDTGADLRDVAVLFSGNVFRLGDLAIGESGRVQVPYWQQTNRIHLGWFNYGSQMFPYGGSRSDSGSRERGMLDGYLNGDGRSVAWRAPIIVGFSEDQTAWFEVGGKQAKADNLTMWVQPFEWNAVIQSDEIVPGSILPYITKQEMSSIGYEFPSRRMNLSTGSLEFEYQLPETQDGVNEIASYETLTIYQEDTVPGGLLELFIWHDKLQEWEPLNTTAATIHPADEAAAYLTGTNAIRMKLTTTQPIIYGLPDIGLERGKSE